MWRGTLLHELFHLPIYLKQVAGVRLGTHHLFKIPFGPHNRQYSLVLKPNVPLKAWVFYWHGGGWQFGTPEQFSVTAKPWLEAGYGVIIPSYRRLPLYQFSSIRADTIAALASIRRWWDEQSDAHSNSLPIILLGMSAGGHLASIVGLDESIRAQAGWINRSIAGVICAGGVLDLQPMRFNPVIRILAGEPGSETFTQANPVNHIHADAPPFLLIHGKKDGMAPFGLAERFKHTYSQVADANQLQLTTLADGSHLDAGRWMFLDGEMQRQIIRQADDWIAVGIAK